MAIARDELVVAVGEVLANAARGKGEDHHHHYVTAYQILARLPDALRQALLTQYGQPGQGAGKNYTAASRVAAVAREIGRVDYLDARGISFDGVGDETEIRSGYPVIGVFRAKRPDED